MYLAIDFDGTVVEQNGGYDDLTTPLRFRPGAQQALISLKRAGHKLLLWSGRASWSLRIDPEVDPWIRANVRPLNRDRWESNRELNEARYQQMLLFVENELPGVFDAIDDGVGGKPFADLFIDDKALRHGAGALSLGWDQIAAAYGEPVYDLKPKPEEK